MHQNTPKQKNIFPFQFGEDCLFFTFGLKNLLSLESFIKLNKGQYSLEKFEKKKIQHAQTHTHPPTQQKLESVNKSPFKKKEVIPNKCFDRYKVFR